MDFFYQFAMYKVLDNFSFTTKDLLDECLIKNSMTGEMTTRPCDTVDSSGQTWIDSVLRVLPLEGPGSELWTPYTRRRLLRWTTGNENISNRDSCASFWNNEIVLRPCDETHAYICKIKNGKMIDEYLIMSLFSIYRSTCTVGTSFRNMVQGLRFST
ncbi:uncharacterized protein LOC111120415 isoform X2 [Crassostrea virginica]